MSKDEEYKNQRCITDKIVVAYSFLLIIVIIGVLSFISKVEILKDPGNNIHIGVGIYDFTFRSIDRGPLVGRVPLESHCKHPGSDFCENNPNDIGRFLWIVWDRYPSAKGRRNNVLEGKLHLLQ